MATTTISASTTYSLGVPSGSEVGVIVFQTNGMTVDCSVVPQIRIAGDPGATLYDKTYYNLSTQAAVTAGTAITSDGIYLIIADAVEVVLDATVTTGTATVEYWGLTGAAATMSVGSGGGGGGGDVNLTQVGGASITEGQKTMSASLPVVVASDQSAIAVKAASGAFASGSIADGADVALGATTDAANTTGTTGTVSGKLRGLVTILADVWVSASHYLKTRITDGTNFMPTMDAVGRRGYQTITDGTNTMPTMDAAGRAGFVKVTDGTNTQPTGDAAARAIFEKITDGTTTAGVDATSTGLKVAIAADLTTNAGSKSTVAQVSVGTSSTSIIAANSARKSLVITNQGASTIYVGNSGVTTSTGFALAAGASISDVTTVDAWYGVVATGSVTAGVIEVS